jgi:peptidoglycan/xylan/chitin deacetylase (PgdA/CDA1 family)
VVHLRKRDAQAEEIGRLPGSGALGALISCHQPVTRVVSRLGKAGWEGGGRVSKPGRLVISLDFELYWGMRDHSGLDEVRDALLGTRRAIPELLSLFSEFEIRATWATVGFLFCDGFTELRANQPEVLPRYENVRLDPYTYQASAALGASEREDPFHFAPSLIREIAACPGQEIGSHTFSHYYCFDDGGDSDAFRADIRAARRVATACSIELRSFVFPRNQVYPGYLAPLAEEGFACVRGNSASRAHRPTPSGSRNRISRAARLADAYLPVLRHGREGPRWTDGLLLDVPASRFLRPYQLRLRHLESRRRGRIIRELREAAIGGHTYHLWWHPENFGRWTDANLAFLRSLLEEFARLRDACGMQSCSMADCLLEIAQ